jgi:4-hydroxy-3-polyprenylbenzoate decarboxylase
MTRPLIVAITGASGVIYGVDMLRALKALGQPVHLIVSEAAARTLLIETDTTLEEVRSLADEVYSNKDIAASVSSGSFRTRGMAIAPCSIKTLSAVANSFNADLISRAADVTLKEGRRLVLMVRETPLHKGHLDLMARAADLGAVILPPMPAFYHRPQSIQDIIDQSVGRTLDQFEIEHNLFRRWHGDQARREQQGGNDE